MKKLITICLLVVTFVAGAITMDAKTSSTRVSTKTSRTASQSGSFSITCLLHKETQYGNTGFMFNSDSKIEAALKKAGFSLKSKKVTKGEIDDGTEGDTAPGKTIDYVYTKKGITVKWSSYVYDEAPNQPYKDVIEIIFNDNAAKDSFIKSIKSNGYKNDGYGIYRDAADWIYIQVNGKEVTLYGNWE